MEDHSAISYSVTSPHGNGNVMPIKNATITDSSGASIIGSQRLNDSPNTKGMIPSIFRPIQQD